MTKDVPFLELRKISVTFIQSLDPRALYYLQNVSAACGGV